MIYKSTKDKLYFLKMNENCSFKDTIKRMKIWKTTNWEQIFSKYISCKELIFKVKNNSQNAIKRKLSKYKQNI